MNRWQKIVTLCAGLSVIGAVGYSAWGILVRIDARWEKAEAAEQYKKETKDQLQDIRIILQLEALEKLKGQRDELLKKQKTRGLTDYEERSLNKTLENIKSLEEGLKPKQ